MTFVIRITLSLLAAVTVISLTSDADAQLFRRLRDNIRNTYPPQTPVAPQSRPQLQPQRRGRAVGQPQGQTGGSLTPYSRLTPEQRNASAKAQATNPQADRTAQPNLKSEKINVRVVTYYDPRTGRTFQRRFLLPPNNDASAQVDKPQVAGGNSPATRPTRPKKPVYDKIPRRAVVNPPQQLSARPRIAFEPEPKSLTNIPSMSVKQVQTPIQTSPATAQQLPLLAGPSSVMTTAPAAPSPIYVQPTFQATTAQKASTPTVAIAVEPVANDEVAISQDVGNEIVIDTAVTLATADYDANDTTNSISSVASDEGAPVAFSVLEMADSDVDATTESTEFDIEIAPADEVKAFFGE